MQNVPTSASYSFTARVDIPNTPGNFARLATRIAELHGNLGAVDIVSVGRDVLTRDLTVDANSEKHAESIIEGIRELEGVRVRSVSDRVFLAHLGGKISVESKIPVNTRDRLSIAYTPGVARVCRAIAADKKSSYNLTIRGNTVAIVSDGTAVLGLGDIGPEAAMPVMEGKAMLFKEFAGVDAFPICLDTKDVDRIVSVVEALAPTFGGINLEDISAPRCFEIEERLKQSLDIPVFHDDQHGTAVVVTAALLNALKIVNKKIEDIRVSLLGVGAAGVACTKMLLDAGVKDVIGCDRVGTIYRGRRESMNFMKDWFADNTNHERIEGGIMEASEGADVFLGLSGPDLFPVEALKSMAKDPIVFALANPDPEIRPEVASEHAPVVATGRSDYPNQINNVLAFPGIFRGALDVHAKCINEQMKQAAAKAIAESFPESELIAEHIIPSVFDKRVSPAVAKAVAIAASETGVARRPHRKPRQS